MITGAEQIAMGEQYAFCAERRDHRIGQQRGAGAPLEYRAIQKIAVSLHHVQRRARIDERAQAAADGLSRRVRIVITDPGFEQIAEDVQRGGTTRFAGEEIEECLDRRWCRGIDVQIGDEEMTHAWILAVKCRGPAPTVCSR